MDYFLTTLTRAPNWRVAGGPSEESDVRNTEARARVKYPEPYFLVLTQMGEGYLDLNGTKLHLLGPSDARMRLWMWEGLASNDAQFIPFATWGSGDLLAFNDQGQVVFCNHDIDPADWKQVVGPDFHTWLKRVLPQGRLLRRRVRTGI